MRALLHDIRYAFRALRASPAFTVTALLALTLGIGVNTAVFSIVNAVVLRPIAVPESDRLVFVMNKSNDGVPITLASPAHFMHWRDVTEVLEDVAAWRALSLARGAQDRSETITVGTVSADYFRVLRAPLERGRAFSAEDDLPGAANVAVVGYQFWARQLGGDPAILGKTLDLSGRDYTIVGVAGRDFDVREFGDPEVWVPLGLAPTTSEQGLSLQVLARLREGVSLRRAQDRLAIAFAAYRERYPESMEATSGNANHGFTALPADEVVVGGARSRLGLLTAAVVLVLVVACANVASLLLVRGARRERAIAIRAALGADRGAIVRLLLAESGLLALAGGVCGLVVGLVGARALLAIDTGGLPRLDGAGEALAFDWRVAAFAFGLSVVTGVAFGLAPALAGARDGLSFAMNRAGGRGSAFRAGRARAALVATEVGLAVVLLIGAALLVRTMLALGAVELGFRTERLLALRTSLPDARFAATADVAVLAQNVLERVRAMPEVEAAASSWSVPTQNAINLPFDVVGRDDQAGFTGIAFVAAVSPAYFDTLAIPVLAGRSIDTRDDAAAPPVAVVDRAFAERYFGDGDPLEEQIVVGGGPEVVPEAAAEPARRIVGIVGNVRAVGIHDDAGPTIYFPIAQTSNSLNSALVGSAPFAWLVRTRASSAIATAAIREEVSRASGEPTTQVVALKDALEEQTAPQRLMTWLMNVFGGAALLLATVGIYGLIAYAVEQRRHEIGVRMALGAEPSSLRLLVIRDGMIPVVAGAAVGVVAAYFLANLLAATLFGVAPHDFGSFAAAPLALLTVGLVAAAVPAVRAGRVQPTVALRHD